MVIKTIKLQKASFCTYILTPRLRTCRVVDLKLHNNYRTEIDRGASQSAVLELFTLVNSFNDLKCAILEVSGIIDDFKSISINIYCAVDLDPVYTVPDSVGHDIEFGWFAVIFTLTTFFCDYLL